MGMQLVGVGNQTLWHTIRNSDGSWQAHFGEIEGVVAGGPPGFRLASCGSTDGAVVQVVGLGNDGDLWHTLRNADGTWQTDFGKIEGEVRGGPRRFTNISCAGADGVLQVVGLGNDGNLWHTLRNADGTWQTDFGQIEGEVRGGPRSFTNISCAGADGVLQVVGLGNDGNLWHTLRNADGTWQTDFGQIEGEVRGGPRSFTNISCAGADGVLQVVGLGNDGNLWHTLRNADGTWQTDFGQIEGEVRGGPRSFTNISCAGADGVLQVVGLGNDGNLWHTLRNADGTWQTDFGSVENVSSGGPNTFTDISSSEGANAT